MQATQNGNALDVWDDGFGQCWVVIETYGVIGVVRATTWEEAYECALDEIMYDADPDDPATYARDYDPDADEGDLSEHCHYRSNGVPSNPSRKSPIAFDENCRIVALADWNRDALIRCGMHKIDVTFADEFPEWSFDYRTGSGTIQFPDGRTVFLQGDEATALDDLIESCDDETAIGVALGAYDHVAEWSA